MVKQIQLSVPSNITNRALFQFVKKLTTFPVQVHHPSSSDGFIYTSNAGAPGLVSALWTPYESNVDYYEAIASSDLYVVYNETSVVTEPMARGMLYALLQQKPILLIREPVFDKQVDTYIRVLIAARLDQYTVLGQTADEDESAIYEHLQNAPEYVDYHLNKHETTVVKAILREHFRNLLISANPSTTQSKIAVQPVLHAAA